MVSHVTPLLGQSRDGPISLDQDVTVFCKLLLCPYLMGDWRGGETDVKHLLTRLYRSSTNLLADIQFICADQKPVWAHKLVLALASQYFQDLFYPWSKTLQEPVLQTFNLLDVDKRILTKFLDFVYTGQVEVGCLDDVWSLVSLANRFTHLGLSRLCVARALESLMVKNVVQNLEKSILVGELRVEEACWRNKCICTNILYTKQ